MAHFALLDGRFKNVVINDIDAGMPQLFFDSISGKYQDEKRWISREDIMKLKDSDAYVRTCWSFGNAGVDYLYSREVEPWKKALHYARVLGDFSEFEKMGINISDASQQGIIKNHDELKVKYIKWYCREVLKSDVDVLELQQGLTEKIERNSEKLREYLNEGLRKSGKRPCDVDRFLGTNGMAGHYFSKSQWEFPTREIYKKLQGFIELPLDYEEVYGLASLMEALQSLQSFCGDYRDVKIKTNSVIYCDIPYEGTSGYVSGAFDYQGFYKWTEKQTEPVFVSSYDLPADKFTLIASIQHTSLLSATSNHEITERLYIPKHQSKSYKIPGALFNFDDF